MLRSSMLLPVRPEVSRHACAALKGFPTEVLESYLAFAEGGEIARLDEVVLGALQFYLPTPPPQPLVDMPGKTRLMHDLGCDSLTMVDLVFLGENLFGVQLEEDQLARVTTLEDLCAEFRRLVASGPAIGYS